MNHSEDQVSELRDVAHIQREQLRRANIMPLVRQRIAAAPVRHGRPMLRLATGLGLVAVGAAAALVVVTRPPAALSFSVQGRPARVGETLQATDTELPVQFSDGTMLLLRSGARAQVVSLDARGARVTLEGGALEASVVHGPGTHWAFAAGPYEVVVTGTSFSLEWNRQSQELALLMRTGSVEVTQQGRSGHSATVRAGQSLHAAAPGDRFEVSDSETSPPSTQPGAPSPTAAAPAEVPPPAAPTRSPVLRTQHASGDEGWRKLAAAAHYPEALRAAEQAGFELECRRENGDGLLLLGDVARLAGDPGRAELAYRTARRRFPSLDRATFALGLVAFEQRRDFRAAATWFAEYGRRFPGGLLARESAGRLVEALERAGDADGAGRAAQEYLARYPGGPHAALARRIMAQ